MEHRSYVASRFFKGPKEIEDWESEARKERRASHGERRCLGWLVIESFRYFLQSLSIADGYLFHNLCKSPVFQRF